MADNLYQKLKAMVGETKQWECMSSACKGKTRTWIFCIEDQAAVFASTKFCWKCGTCGQKKYVST